jgi:ATP-dependent helicase/nuclease subunit A
MIAAARSYSDWLGLWFSQAAGKRDRAASEGEIGAIHWHFHSDGSLVKAESRKVLEPLAARAALPASNDVAGMLETLRKRIEWKYPFGAATLEPAKTSVSGLRRRANEAMDEEAAELYGIGDSKTGRLSGSKRPFTRHPGSGADLGSVHHTFLQFVSLERVSSADELKAEAERLVRQKTLTKEDAALLNIKDLAAFWQSELGKRIRAQRTAVRRELRFTARLSATEVAELVGEPAARELTNEFLVVQGAVDLAVVLPERVWLVDFKTDVVKADGLEDKARFYEAQLKLYARALTEIYRRPVSEAWLYFLHAGESVEVELVRHGVRAAV